MNMVEIVSVTQIKLSQGDTRWGDVPLVADVLEGPVVMVVGLTRTLVTVDAGAARTFLFANPTNTLADPFVNFWTPNCLNKQKS